MATALGDKIRRLRKEKKLTLDQLAELTGSSKSYIWELENKTPPRPSAEKLSKIADKLGVTIEYLLDEEATVSEEDAEDAAFYRKYRRMDPGTKAKLRQGKRGGASSSTPTSARLGGSTSPWPTSSGTIFSTALRTRVGSGATPGT
jgi:transcriptional regulator with XRE-family HTH domain